MLRPIKEIKFFPIIVGFFKHFKILNFLFSKKTISSVNSRYYYSVWLRHLSYIALYNNNKVPLKVTELGPGDCLGVGLSALLSGAEQYYALDVIKYWRPDRNVQMLNDLLKLFNSRENIPNNVEFPNLFPILEDYSFPSYILTDERLKYSLEPTRIERIRSELEDPDNFSNMFINFKIQWFDLKVLKERSIDLVLSQAVMQHVDDLENAYKAMKIWLCDTGFISHTINFTSHGFTKSWNGHWTLSEFIWKVVRGGRIYAINRQPLSTHLEMLRKNSFILLHRKERTSINKLRKEDISKQFKNLTEEDLATSGIYFIARNA